MTLGEFARLLDVEPKWVLNRMAGLGLPARYTIALARRLALCRAIHEATGMPLERAAVVARHCLRAYRGERATMTVLPTPDGDVALTVDVYRVLSTFYVRLAAVRTMFAPRVRGRPATRDRDALQAAEHWGLDLMLIRDNLAKSPEQRLRQLDAMAVSAHSVHRPLGDT